MLEHDGVRIGEADIYWLPLAWLVMARPMPLDVPPSVGDPVALPPTAKVLTAIPTTEPVELCEA